MRLRNTGAGPLTVTGLTLTGTFGFDPALTLPQVVPAGGTLDVPLRFVAIAAPTVQVGC